MNLLVTRCTLYDRAGHAMIRGALNGFKILGADVELRALVRHYDNEPNSIIEAFVDPADREDAFAWADGVIDLGGLCFGMDNLRIIYLDLAKKLKKSYIFMSQSFIDPQPFVKKATSWIARGYQSQQALRKIGVKASVGADLGFLVKPGEVVNPGFDCGFTTYPNRDLSEMNKAVTSNSVQLIWKKQRNGVEFEPELDGLSAAVSGSVEYLYGFISNLSKVYTARYHAAVAAIKSGVSCQTFPKEATRSKYEDLLSMSASADAIQLSESALDSCREVLKWI